jgi:hypothetical protein
MARDWAPTLPERDITSREFPGTLSFTDFARTIFLAWIRAWVKMMDIEKVIDRRVAAAQIEYFLEDPEDDPDRAGDGIYFRHAGKLDWSGAWQSETEAEEILREELEDDFVPFGEYMQAMQRRSEKRRFIVSVRSRKSLRVRDNPWGLWRVYHNDGRPYRHELLMVLDCASKAAARRAMKDICGIKHGAVVEENSTLSTICRSRGLVDPSISFGEMMEH